MGLGGTGKYEIPDDPALINTYLARIQSTEGTLFLNSYQVCGHYLPALQIMQIMIRFSKMLKQRFRKTLVILSMTLTGGSCVHSRR